MDEKNWLEELLFEVLEKTDSGYELINNSPNLVQELLNEVLPEITKVIRKSLDEKLKENLDEANKFAAEFKDNLYKVWKKPLDLFEMMIQLNIELGQRIISVAEKKDGDIKNEVLFRLHSRACKISWEILELLKNGFADGAMARWRSIYEISVIATFLHDKPESLSQMYVDHLYVRNRKELIEYQKNCEKLGYLKFEQEELSELNGIITELKNKYGKEFTQNDYGWAKDYLPKGKRNFKGLESETDFSHFRSFYQLANNHIHSGSKSLMFSLGLYDESEVVLAGPSNYGLSDPGWNTARSLLLSYLTISSFNDSVESIVYLNILVDLCQDIKTAFLDAEIELIKRIEENET